MSIIFLEQSMSKVLYAVQIQRNESRTLLMNGQCPLYFLAEAIPWLIGNKLYRWVINRGMYTL
jgi:hypothetical protein